MKRDYERAIKKSVSMPGIMADEADDRRRALRLPTFSDYIQHLIRNDTDEHRKTISQCAA
jgi:hypothetical protein